MASDSDHPRGAVLITGSSTGIGKACALHFDQLGFRVFAGVRREADGQALKTKASPALTPLILDVTDPAHVVAARDSISAALGDAGLAGLVNNAGIAIAGPLEVLPLDEFRRQLEVNVTGQLAVTQALLPLLRKARGRIVMMGSISGRLATPFIGAYGISKFALEAMADALRIELMPWGIEVSIIEPGSIATPIWEKSREHSAEIARSVPPEQRELYFRQYEAMRAAVKQAADAAIPVLEVAKVVEHALTATRPKTRYLVGRDAKLGARVAKFLPDRLRDGLIVRRLALPARPER